MSVIGVVWLAPLSARADVETPTSEPTPTSEEAASPRVDVDLTMGVGSIRQKGTYSSAQSYAGFELALLYRATPLLSFGAVGSHATYSDGQNFARVASELRVHALHRRFVDAWGGAELGLGFAKYAPYVSRVCFDGASTPATGCQAIDDGPAKRTRLGPEAGLGVGIDFRPLPWISLGVEARAFAVLFDVAPSSVGNRSAAGGLPSGPTPAVFGGMTLAAHVPFL